MAIMDYTKERELIRLRCKEKKFLREAEIIRTALNELGCEEVPAGCDLSMAGTFVEPTSALMVSHFFFKSYSFSFIIILNIQKKKLLDNGMLSLRRNKKIKSPFKSMPSINESNNEGASLKVIRKLSHMFEQVDKKQSVNIRFLSL